MSTLRRQEPVGLGLRRIACAQVESAIRCLTRQPGQAGNAVEAMRGAEAALTLLEPHLPRPIVRRERVVVARLSEGLDEMTLPALLLDRLGARYKKTPGDSGLARAVKALSKQLNGQSNAGIALSSRAGNFNPAIYRLVADMAELRGNMGNWPVDTVPDDGPPRGTRRVYTRARKLLSEPITRDTLGQTVATLTLLHQHLSILSKSCPGMVKAQRKLLTRAVEELQTLRLDTLLDSALRKQLKEGDTPPPRAEPVGKRATAAIGNDLAHALAETPTAFMTRLSVYWSAWRAGKDAE